MNNEITLYKKIDGMYWEVTKEQVILELLEANKSLEKRIDKVIKIAQMNIDIGFDYDGYNDIENLKKIIDELVKYSADIRNILKGEDDE